MLYNPQKTGPAIVVGDACVDITIELQYYLEGPESEKLPHVASGGGTSSNSAVALQKLGVPTAFMGTLGNDYGGRFMVRDLEANGVDTTFTIMDPVGQVVGNFKNMSEKGTEIRSVLDAGDGKTL